MSVISSLTNFLTNLSFKLYHYLILPLRYSVTVEGGKRIGTQRTDERGGTLFLSNHPSHLDPSMVGFALWERSIRICIWTLDYVFKHAFTRFAARSADTVKLIKVPNVFEGRSRKHASDMRRLIQKTVEKLRKGENVLFFPGGKQKHEAFEEVCGKSAVQRILKLYPEVNIVLVTVTGMWGSRFSKAVSKAERSNLKGQSLMRFLWSMTKIILLNFIFFIPKRHVTIEFTPVGANFPRQGTRKEINQYLEQFFNRGFGKAGEPLQKVSDYFWKTKFPHFEYHLKSYRYEAERIPEQIREEVIQIIADKVGLKPEEIKEQMHLGRDLAIDSLETAEILVELEKRFEIPKYAPKHVMTVGHLVALAARVPVDYVPIRGEFSQIIEEPASMVRAWQVCTGFIIGLFSYLDTQR